MKGSYGRTALLWAAANGHVAVVKLLIERDDVDQGLFVLLLLLSTIKSSNMDLFSDSSACLAIAKPTALRSVPLHVVLSNSTTSL